MLEIEDKLKTPNYKNELLEMLHSELQQMRDLINKGLSPEEYNNYSKYVIALESSLVILNKNTTLESSIN